MKSVFFKTIGLLYLTVVLFAATITGIFWNIFRFNIAIAIVIILVAAIPVSIIIFALLMNGEKNSKFGKLHTEFMKELTTNGYSERFLAITEEAVTANRNGEKVGKTYLRDFVLYAADYYNMTGNYNKALSLISNLNEFDYNGTSDVFIDYGMSAMMYYCALMDAYRGLNDKASASTLIGRAKPFLSRNFKLEVLEMGADSLYYNYCMLIEDYERAGEYIRKLNSYTSAEAQKYFSRYYYEAEYDVHLGKKQEAAQALKKIEPLITGNMKAALTFCYELFQDKLGLREEMKG